jgi:hypothetical protein
MPGMQEFPIMDAEEGLPLFYPHIPRNAKKYVSGIRDSE